MFGPIAWHLMAGRTWLLFSQSKMIRTAWLAGQRLGASKYNDWQFSIGLDALTAVLQQWGAEQQPRLAFGPVQTVTVLNRTASGRLGTIAIQTPLGTQRLSGQTFRMAVGSQKMRSTLATSFAVNGRRLQVRGRGFGHGVGLSQISAYAMALDGHPASAIIAHFYPSTQLRRCW